MQEEALELSCLLTMAKGEDQLVEVEDHSTYVGEYICTTYLGDNENQWFFDELEISGTDGYVANGIPVKPGWRYPWRCRERVVCGLRRWWRWWSMSWCFCCFLPLLSLWKWATQCLCVREFGFCFIFGFIFIVFRFTRQEVCGGLGDCN